MYVLVTSVM